MKIKPIIAWYDIWVGVFVDTTKRRIYVLPLPCIGIVIDLAEPKKRKCMKGQCLFFYKDMESHREDPQVPDNQGIWWTCSKCGHTYKEHCGLDVLSKHGKIGDRQARYPLSDTQKEISQ